MSSGKAWHLPKTYKIYCCHNFFNQWFRDFIQIILFKQRVVFLPVFLSPTWCSLRCFFMSVPIHIFAIPQTQVPRFPGIKIVFKGMFYCCWLGFTTLCMTVNRIISLWTPMPHRLDTRLWLYFPLRDLAVFACLQDWFLFPWIVACCLDDFYMLHESHAFGCFPASAIYASKFYSRCFPVTSITMPSKLLTYTQQSCSYNV